MNTARETRDLLDFKEQVEGLRPTRTQRLLQRRAEDHRRAGRMGWSVGAYRAHYGPLWQAKALARRIGLRYWPALIRPAKTGPDGQPLQRRDGKGYLRGPLPCSVAAFKAAEAVLSKKHGFYGDKTAPDQLPSHGGWDSAGYWGVSPQAVCRMWFAAGCRNSRKFRLQVRAKLTAKKGDSAPFFAAFAVGWKWADRNGLFAKVLLGRKALAALGRIPSYCRWAAVRKVLAPDSRWQPGGWNVQRPVVRIRDLDWVAVRAVTDAIRNGNVRMALPYLPVRAAAALTGKVVTQNTSRDWCRRQLAPIVCPAYPSLSWDDACAISTGTTPVEVSGGKLTRKEAHEWLKSGKTQSPEEWLSLRLSRRVGTEFHHRSMKVLRWLERLAGSKDRWQAVTRERMAPGPGGVMRTFTALSVLDEVADDDVRTGSDSVDAVLRRASERLGEVFLTKAAGDHRLLMSKPAWADRLGRYCRLLRTPAELVEEGKALGHCVGGYASAVEAGQCFILSLRSPRGRSTVELTPDLRVRQHTGSGNGAPPERHVKLLAAILRRAKGGRP